MAAARRGAPRPTAPRGVRVALAAAAAAALPRAPAFSGAGGAAAGERARLSRPRALAGVARGSGALPRGRGAGARGRRGAAGARRPRVGAARPAEGEAEARPRSRLSRAIPRWDDLDRRVATVALPSVANLLIIPLVNAVDTYWVGRMGSALALAGQGAANQVFSSIFWVIAFLPSVTTPLVAKAAASGNEEEARNRVCEAAFLAAIMGSLGASLLAFGTPRALSLVLEPGAPAAEFALPYLRIRALSFVPALLSTVGFASFRGVMDTVTPLRVVAFSNMLNIVLDPVLIFWAGWGITGAAAATVLAEVVAGTTYAALLFRRRLMTWKSLLRVPTLKRLGPLLRGGATVQIRTLALNTAFVFATRRAQSIDASGVSAAAYAISMQFWQLGGVVLFALQGSASILVPAELARAGGGPGAARAVADRLLVLGLCLGAMVGCGQLCALPLLGAFSALPEVQSAAVTPVAIASVMSIFAGVVFAGEGIMIGQSAWGALALLTVISASGMMACLEVSKRLGLGLSGVWLSIFVFNVLNLAGVLFHHLVVSPRRERRLDQDTSGWVEKRP